MENPVDHYWALRLQKVERALEKNGFAVHVVRDSAAAKELVLDRLLPSMDVRSVSWGGSMTLLATGIYDALKADAHLEIVDTFEKGIHFDRMLDRRRRSLLVDLFLTGTNAVTEKGQLVNLDMIGNRVAAITFGPRHVVLVVGRNKIVADVPSAVQRIKTFAAPVNAMRLDKKTPCTQDGCCRECSSPERICNHWTVTEKSFPQGRIHVVLTNEDLGL